MATSRTNYFNTLPLAEKLDQLAKCRFMGRNEFADGAKMLNGMSIVIVGCGAQVSGRKPDVKGEWASRWVGQAVGNVC